MKLDSAILPLLIGAFAGITSLLPAQTFTVLHNFTNSATATPLGGLVSGGSTLYGTSPRGGGSDQGFVYAVSADGSGFSILHDFASDPNGGTPEGGLVLSGDTLFGTTALGGVYGPWGTVFSVQTNGSNFQVLNSFTGDPTIGQHPHPRLTLSGATLYGVASGQAAPGWGSLFSIQTDGSAFDSLYTFTTPHLSSSVYTNIDGEQPSGSLILSDGMLYGTAYGGGTAGYGTVFTLDPNGNNFTVLHTFTNNPDGAYVRGSLLLIDSTLYGTTWKGGINDRGTVFSLGTNGNGYRVLHSFLTNGVDGQTPWSGLVFAGARLYGTTEQGGGINARGTIFSMNLDGSGYAIFHSFVMPSGTFTNIDGIAPEGDLIASGNTLYGTTQQGGALGFGTAFSLSLPRPFISQIQLSGTTLLLQATNAAAGGNYTALMSPSLTLPLDQWTAIARGNAEANGNLTITAANGAAPGAAQRFYILQAQ